jgi:hypothetical protein
LGIVESYYYFKKIPISPSKIALWTLHLQCKSHGLLEYLGNFDTNHIITFKNVEIFNFYFLKENKFLKENVESSKFSIFHNYFKILINKLIIQLTCVEIVNVLR